MMPDDNNDNQMAAGIAFLGIVAIAIVAFCYVWARRGLQ